MLGTTCCRARLLAPPCREDKLLSTALSSKQSTIFLLRARLRNCGILPCHSHQDCWPGPDRHRPIWSIVALIFPWALLAPSLGVGRDKCPRYSPVGLHAVESGKRLQESHRLLSTKCWQYKTRWVQNSLMQVVFDNCCFKNLQIRRALHVEEKRWWVKWPSWVTIWWRMKMYST